MLTLALSHNARWIAVAPLPRIPALPKLEAIKDGYSYHDTSGPAASPRKDTCDDLDTVESAADDKDGGGDDAGGALVVVGHVLGGVASGAVGVAGGVAGVLAGVLRGELGLGRLFNRRRDTSTSPGDNIADAVGEGSDGGVLPERSSTDPVEEVDWRGISSLSSSSYEERLCEGTSGASVPSAAVEGGDDLVKRGTGGEDVAEGTASSLSASTDQKRLAERENERSSQVEALASHAVDPPAQPCSDAGGIMKEEGHGANDNGRLAAGEQTRRGCSGVQEGNRATGEGGLDASNCADDAVEAEPPVEGKTIAPGRGKGSLGSESSGSGPMPPRPTESQAAEADALVGDAMVTYWAAFGKVIDTALASAYYERSGGVRANRYNACM